MQAFGSRLCRMHQNFIGPDAFGRQEEKLAPQAWFPSVNLVVGRVVSKLLWHHKPRTARYDTVDLSAGRIR